MSDNITVRGYVATDVKSGVAVSGLAYASFRMCSTERRFDRNTSSWADGQTNWYAVSMFRQLATNAGVSIKKGDKVVVSGRLRVRPWIREDGRTGTSVDIDAETVGHDLMWGTAHFHRTSADRTGGETSTAGDPSDVQDSDVDYPRVDQATGEIMDASGGYPELSDDDGAEHTDGHTDGQTAGADAGHTADTDDADDSSGGGTSSPEAGRQLSDAPF
ncbi:single-stranded DNA-binding protein [Arthrobacter sp. Bz4]|uniref:single-stranded DNA-binding protein n=1 Tax=Arthrobacter sp. Bz4 TaxID=2171979 RepID=UPI000D51D931|nr:single-stranded DNA-binding protein [Arthrobacter sp. Bz4]PVE20028.1 single-stranded DNA-binding protein [Arthrobacter sp. Bz4]